MIEVTGSLVENEPALLVYLKILGKSRERKPACTGFPSDVPNFLNRGSVLPSFVACLNSRQIKLLEGFAASLCRPTIPQLIPSVLHRINERIKCRGGPFKWSWHQLTPHPARLLETKAACLFRLCENTTAFWRREQCLLDQLDVVRNLSFGNAVPPGNFAADFICSDSSIMAEDEGPEFRAALSPSASPRVRLMSPDQQPNRFIGG